MSFAFAFDIAADAGAAAAPASAELPVNPFSTSDAPCDDDVAAPSKPRAGPTPLALVAADVGAIRALAADAARGALADAEVVLSHGATGIARLVLPPSRLDALTGAGVLDVLPGEYEGGAKLWEATRDVLDLLVARAGEAQGASGGDARAGGGGASGAPPTPRATLVAIGEWLGRSRAHTIVDLGAGAGLLGCALAAALRAASEARLEGEHATAESGGGAAAPPPPRASPSPPRRVVLQDHDAPVLRHIAAPNVALNVFGLLLTEEEAAGGASRLGGEASTSAAAAPVLPPCADPRSPPLPALSLLAGSWEALVEELEGRAPAGAAHAAGLARGAADLIVASEVLYSLQ
jgi:hypothetical protein